MIVVCFLHPDHGFHPSAGKDQWGWGQQGLSLPLSADGTVPDTKPLGKQEHRVYLISLWDLAVPTPLPVLPACCFPPSLSRSFLSERYGRWMLISDLTQDDG